MLKKLKLKTKLLGGFLVVLVLSAIVGGVGFQAMSEVKSRSQKMEDVNTVAQLMLETRVFEKNYMIRKDEKSRKEHSETIAKLIQQTKITSDTFADQINKDQMTLVDNEVKSYLTAFEAYADLSKQRDSRMEEMRASGRTMLTEMDNMVTDEKQKLTDTLNQITKTQGEPENTISDRIGKILDADQIVKLILDTRKNEKEFIISNGGKEWKEAVSTNIKSIKGLLTSLKPRFTQQVNIAQTDAVLAAITSYIQKFESYSDLMVNQQQAAAVMVEKARNVQKICDEAMQDQKAKMKSQISSATILLLSTCVIAFIIGISLTIIITRGITGPVIKAVNLTETMAKGDFTNQLHLDQKDEIGLMANSLNAMARQLGTTIREIVEGVNSLSASSTDLAAVSRQLSGSARETADKSSSVAASAEEMSVNIQSVSAAMEQSTSNVSMVASATEEMSATVSEIGRSAEKARSISESAVKQSQLTSEQVKALGESARKIGRFTETITEISDQTNLLALNATIEAARAGDAGKGFAVVANEIKELARQTAAATVDIRSQIDAMQSTISSTIEGIGIISEVINEINNAINGIASAVEEQTTATNEIADNISQASQGIAEVNENVAQSTIAISDITRDITLINQQSAEVGDGSNQVQLSAHGLSVLANQLDNLMKQFKVCPA